MPDQASSPAYVVVGHVARDVAPGGGYTFGGTALYSGLTAQRCAVETGILTSIPADVDLSILTGTRIHNVSTGRATVFDNRYGPDGRVQYLYSRAAPLGVGDVPAAWRSAPIVHLGPIDDEVDPAIADLFPHALKAATPQGWLRRWGEDYRVWPLPHDYIIPRLPDLDVVVMSEEDVAGDEGAVDAYRERVRIVILTHGKRGATVYAGKGVLQVPAFAAQEVDPTGAGDVFATTFLIRYRQEKDLFGAARFASAAASFVVEGPGATTIPTLEQIERRLANSR